MKWGSLLKELLIGLGKRSSILKEELTRGLSWVIMHKLIVLVDAAQNLMLIESNCYIKNERGVK